MPTKYIGLLLGPLVFIILLNIPAPPPLSLEAWRVIALAALMLVWWVTEAIPIPVTALLPMVGLPLLGIQSMRAAAAPYASPIVFLFMGGFMVALAMERWQLHKRIALNIIALTGTSANRIILGFMLATAALSMFISNTATTIMMLPIAMSVIGLLSQSVDTKTPGYRNFAISMMLGIAYAANIGGTATIVGTPPNVVLVGYIKEAYDVDIGFAEWLIVGLPFAALMLAITYLVINRLVYPNRLGRFSGAQNIIDQQIRSLGKMDLGEKLTLAVFSATALAWITRKQLNALLPDVTISDPIIAILATILLFLIPVNLREGQFLLQWKDTEKLPWGILLLFGGGLSLAAALDQTGIVGLIGDQFANARIAPFWIIIGMTAVALFLTEVMSNVALVTIFLPVVGGVAIGLGIPPLLACIPVTLAASCAFMLPMSTPPNAIVFASGYLRVDQMARGGIFLNVLAIILIALIGQQLIEWAFL